MKIVLDTNVLISGLLTPFGSSGEIIRMVSAGKLVLCFDARIVLEYQEVLQRQKFEFNKEHIDMLLDFIQQYGQFVSTEPLTNSLPDSDDEPFLEAAIAGKVKCLVTGNLAHYHLSSRQGVNILSPSEFLDFYRRKNEDTEPRGEV